MIKRDKSFPSPQVIKPGNWIIKEDSDASISYSKRTISVPFSISAAAVHTRAHELGHLKCTPYDPATVVVDWKVPLDAIAYTGDALVETYLHKKGIDYPESMVQMAEINLSQIKSIRMQMGLLACLGVYKWEETAKILDIEEYNKNAMRMVMDKIKELSHKDAAVLFNSFWPVVA